MRAISENSRVTLTIAAVIAGGAWWLSALYSDVQSLKGEVAEVKGDVKTLLKLKRERQVAGKVRSDGTSHADNQDPDGSDS